MTNLPSGTVTFLFTDIEGSTKLAQQHRDDWENLRNCHHAILREAIESNKGYVFQIIGDAFCAAFHTAGDALHAAAKSQRDLDAENWGETPIKVRMGIHTGKAEIQEDGQYHGYLAMSRIQRLMSAGHGGQVLISAATQELLLEDLPEDVSLRDLGERRLKDLIRPEHVYQLMIPGLPVDFPLLKTLDALPNNLPIQLTSFIGREKELDELRDLMERTRLVTLTGVGGTGKTRLALQVAADAVESFHGGVWLVELASLSDPTLLPQTVGTALGLREQVGRTFIDMLKDYLSRKDLLLVLDNCEHLIEACAQLADTLLHAAPQLKILATSREALSIAGESSYPVRSLPLPDLQSMLPETVSQYEAVRLFIDRALAVQPDFQVTNQNVPAVAQICTRLDGIPLAIELAAARVKGLSVEQLASRLDDRFRLLTGGSRTALPRQRTLEATIDWSYKLLSEEERSLLRQLSVFTGGWTLEAVEHVCASVSIESDQILDLLLRLVDKSLVIAEAKGTESRYHMLETIRQYAGEKLSELEEDKMLRDQHLAYFLDLSEKADREIRGPNQVEWLKRLETACDNLRAALTWALESKKADTGLRLASGLFVFWFIRGYLREGINWLERTLSQSDGASKTWEAKALGCLGGMLNSGENPNLVRIMNILERSLHLYQELDDRAGIAWVLNDLGIIAHEQKDYRKAKQLLRESLDLRYAVGDPWSIAQTLQNFPSIAIQENNYVEAKELAEETIEWFRRAGDQRGVARTLADLAELERVMGNPVQAVALLKQSLPTLMDLKDRWSIASALEHLASLANLQNDSQRAVRLFGVAEALREATGMPVPTYERTQYEQNMEMSRKNLDDATFTKVWAEGRAMTMEQAIDYALELQDD